MPLSRRPIRIRKRRPMRCARQAASESSTDHASEARASRPQLDASLDRSFPANAGDKPPLRSSRLMSMAPPPRQSAARRPSGGPMTADRTSRSDPGDGVPRPCTTVDDVKGTTTVHLCRTVQHPPRGDLHPPCHRPRSDMAQIGHHIQTLTIFPTVLFVEPFCVYRRAQPRQEGRRRT